jgi:hypothetical protein
MSMRLTIALICFTTSSHTARNPDGTPTRIPIDPPLPVVDANGDEILEVPVINPKPNHDGAK